jgi:tetratricopeptide (TPR) repeat protein
MTPQVQLLLGNNGHVSRPGRSKNLGSMQTIDLSGLKTSLPASHIALWNKIILGILSHSATPGPDLLTLTSEQPEFALGHAIRGFACKLLARSEMEVVASQALASAKACPPGTSRENAFVLALEDWIKGSPTRATARLQAILDKSPRDALAMKLVQGLCFIMGRPREMRASVEGVIAQWDDHPAKGYLLGCHAFTLEETGEFERAEIIGRHGVELAPDDAWGLHAVAHVFDMTARAADGLSWLEGREASWAHCNNFRYHVWWHKALMHLDMGNFDETLALYDRDIRADKTDDFRDIANAASLLARLNLDGIDVGSRWEELADLSEKRATDGCLAFADLHYMLSLCGGERGGAAAGLISRMSKAKSELCETQRIIAHPGLRLAKGLHAFASGEYANAWLNLRDARADLQTIGGSHAQRDVFQRVCIEAAIRGGYLDAAEGLLTERSTQRNQSIDGYASRRLDLIQAARQSVI